ncbi:MAG TPA: PucR family transcriptional regulator ligand-binding domain-containing protein [Micromonosporaceae bacterium]|nr:PucR family transcriptional regulator ligand-binding domain-containing protein [Micromonosporaceae bacterium]
MRLRDMLDRPTLGLRLLAGDEHLDRPIRRVFTTDLLDPGRYLTGGELVLTGLMWRRTPADSERFVAALAAAEVSALGAGDAALGSVPADLVAACERHSLPLFEVPVEVSFRTITDEVGAERASGLATVLGRHRDLIAAMAGGDRLADLLPRVASELGMACWVLAATGRLVAGVDELAGDDRTLLARAFLTADRLPHHAALGRRRRFTVLSAGGRPEHRLAGWFLAVEETAGADPLPEAVEELVALAALERAQLDEARRVERRLAEHLLRSLSSTVDDAEVESRLVACGLEPDSPLRAIVATVSGPPELAVAVVEELARPPYSVAAVGRLGDEVAAVVPAAVAEDLADRVRVLEAGLGPRGRLAVGVSDPAVNAGALRGALDEARHAHGYAVAQPAPAVVVPSADLASHLLLLAGVPAAARRTFRDRLLGPLEEYDRTHGADLVHTLEEFLGCSGSWTRCAQGLHVHVNTLRYRIGRIEELTGRDLNSFADRVDFFLALRIVRGG